MNAEWWEIALATLIFTVMVWIKVEVEQKRLAEYVRRLVIEMWLSGQGPPSLYDVPNLPLPDKSKLFPPKTE